MMGGKMDKITLRQIKTTILGKIEFYNNYLVNNII